MKIQINKIIKGVFGNFLNKNGQESYNNKFKWFKLTKRNWIFLKNIYLGRDTFRRNIRDFTIKKLFYQLRKLLEKKLSILIDERVCVQD